MCGMHDHVLRMNDETSQSGLVLAMMNSFELVP